jgi:phosphoglycolate phosphatase
MEKTGGGKLTSFKLTEPSVETEQAYDASISDKLQAKKVLLFDLDGTLTDPGTGITRSVAYALEAFGLRIEDLNSLCCFIGPPLKDSFMKYYGFSEEKALQAIEKYREYFRETGIFENEPIAGVESLLRHLAGQGKRLIVATSKPKLFADRILEHFHLAQYFSLVCGSELDGTRSKKGEVIGYALEQAAVADRETAVMVGDREHDVIGAREAGIDCIGVLYGYGAREELESADAVLIVESAEELDRALTGQKEGTFNK